MNTSSPISFKEELSNWKKDLEGFCQKNALLKYRLSEIVDNNEDDSFLQMAEYFQNQLLLKDEKLKKLINQLQQISARTETEKPSDENIQKLEKLRKDICLFQKKYDSLSKEFNEKLMQNS
jgi:DNA integrity scanning protein DisA with diadenylate cyclase activity